jgi:hypothetical protein
VYVCAEGDKFLKRSNKKAYLISLVYLSIFVCFLAIKFSFFLSFCQMRGRHDIAEILVKLALNTNKSINQMRGSIALSHTFQSERLLRLSRRRD